MGTGWDWFGESVRLCVNFCLLLDNNHCLLLDNNLSSVVQQYSSSVGLCLLLDITPCGHNLFNWDIG
jgi:hypothetical protein